MDKFAGFWISVSVFLLWGCSTVAVNYDYDTEADFQVYRTYDWLAQPTAAVGERSQCGRFGDRVDR